MRIQHNIPAMSSYRNYSRNVSAVNKNLEKLSSGYRINRAGDDAAGLAISEKMRLQISGLEQAQNNAKSGINLVQTAEGALTEVHDMLNRMYTLAEQSANGTYSDDVDREQLQKEVNSLRTEINRIADATNYNGINLLDGSLAAGAVKGASYKNMSATEIKGLLLPEGTDQANVTLGTDTQLESEKTGSDVQQFSVKLDGLSFTIDDKNTTLGLKINNVDLKDDEDNIIDFKTAGLSGKLSSSQIASAYDGANVTIAGVKYTATAKGDTLVFDPADGKGTANINEHWNVTWDAPEVDNSKSFTVALSDTDVTAINAAGKFSVGGTEVTLTTDLDTTFADGAEKTAGNFKVTYDATSKKLTFVNEDGSVTTAPQLQYAGEAGTDKTGAGGATASGADAVKATSSAITLGSGQSVSAGGVSIAYDTLHGGGDKPDQAAGDDMTYSWNDATDQVTITAKNAGAAGNNLEYTDKAGNTAKLTGGKDATAGTDTYDISGWTKGMLYIDADNKIDFDTDIKTSIENAALTNYEVSLAADGKTLTVTHKEKGVGKDAPAKVVINKTEGNLDSTEVPKGDKGGANGSLNVSTVNVIMSGDGQDGRLANTVLDLTGKFKDGTKITLGDQTYTVALGADSAFKGAENVVDLTDISADDANLDEIGASRLTEVAKNNTTFSVGHTSTDGKIGLQQLTSVKESTDMSTMDKLASYIGVSTVDGDPSQIKAGKGLTLQIGDTAEEYNKMTVSVRDMHAAGMGIDGIDISTQDGASEAMKKIQAATNYVSDVRGDLGALQNRLDHTINNLSVTQENIQDAESTIRDVDIAKEMMAYTKNNILVQSAQAMLAQANQLPQGVLQLLG